MIQLHIRVDIINHNDLDNFKIWLAKQTFTEYLLTSELASETKKLHLHMYCLTNTSIATLRMSFKRQNTQRDKQYSIQKAKDHQRLIAYITKEGSEILESKNISQEYIDECKDYVITQNNLNNAKTVDKMYHYVQEQLQGQKISRYNIAEKMIDYCSVNSYTPNNWLLISQYNIIHWRLMKGDPHNFDKKLFLDGIFKFNNLN